MKNCGLFLIALAITFIDIITKKFFSYINKFILEKIVIMKKSFLILVCCNLFVSCKFEELKVYEEDIIIQFDTLDIKKIKIETH
tara:strand:+ start:37 stop:288 length:252 start_codon:yes stop_codon:yes gene_type:complete